jgi:DNA modification methylase
MSTELHPNLSLRYVPIGQVTLDPRNPQQHSDSQIKQIARSIDAFGFSVPVLVDRSNTVVAGHARIKAALQLGLLQVPVIRLEHLSRNQVKALQIADNRLAEMSTWNDRLLAETLKELSELELSFSLETTGFSMPEIDLRIQGLLAPADVADPADKIPNSTGQVPVSKLGDHWRLGPHVVLCGNALLADSYCVLLGTERAHLIFSDPPYNVAINGHVSGRGFIQHRDFAMAVGELDMAEFSAFLKTACALMTRYSVDGAIHFLCMDWRHVGELMEAGRSVYSELKNLCIWAKDNGGLGSLYRSRHELVFVFKHGTAPHCNNVQLGKYGRNRTNVWEYPCASTFSRQSDEGNLAALHPTIKPVAMVADAILDCSTRGDIVLDPFMGSGTTLIAAERVGRICRGMEIDPLYVDVIIRRWQSFSGDRAIHAVTGVYFDEAAAVAEARHDQGE